MKIVTINIFGITMLPGYMKWEKECVNVVCLMPPVWGTSREFSKVIQKDDLLKHFYLNVLLQLPESNTSLVSEPKM